ncbi:hypothetical protein GCM10009665_46920 [Kitasatospora nipponensis]|uniref:Resolvase-like protein n=1 Tax=Kitasatospora nipponensis TaxID=258049 RepID=A0ABP4H543_9ACTN
MIHESLPGGDRRGGPGGVPAGGTAAYLRCQPMDPWGMEAHRWAVLEYAEQLGLPRPTVFFDNGCPARGLLPRLEQLLAQVAGGGYHTVLLPGRFVLSLDDRTAADLVRRFEEHGCRVLELPSRRARRQLAVAEAA